MPSSQVENSDLYDKSLVSSSMNLKRSDTLPRIKDNYFSRSSKTYRAPPTPTLEEQSDLEKSFKLDCVAVSNISLDYSRANPKMGTVIPPYNSLNDRSISDFVKGYGARDFLKRNNKTEAEHESMAGKVHDDFFKSGAGYRYLSLRNQFGNGHHPETVDGHQRYQAEQPRVMISYNNMNGYRRNIPKLRTEPPSTFSVDPRWYERVRKTYKGAFNEAELLEHFKNTYMIGYPFHDNNYNHFHPKTDSSSRFKSASEIYGKSKFKPI